MKIQGGLPAWMGSTTPLFMDSRISPHPTESSLPTASLAELTAQRLEWQSLLMISCSLPHNRDQELLVFKVTCPSIGLMPVLNEFRYVDMYLLSNVHGFLVV
jgi:hypothetical protein